jgi:hypothetical protein
MTTRESAIENLRALCMKVPACHAQWSHEQTVGFKCTVAYAERLAKRALLSNPVVPVLDSTLVRTLRTLQAYHGGAPPPALKDETPATSSNQGFVSTAATKKTSKVIVVRQLELPL